MSEIQSVELSKNPINKLPKEYLQKQEVVNLSSQWMQLINLKEAGKSEVEAAELYFEKRKNKQSKKVILEKTKTRYQEKTNKAENNLNDLRNTLNQINENLKNIENNCANLFAESKPEPENVSQENSNCSNLLYAASSDKNIISKDTVMKILAQKNARNIENVLIDIINDENLSDDVKQKYYQALETIFKYNLPDHYKALLLLKTGGATKLAKIDNLFDQTENWKANHTAEKNKLIPKDAIKR